jgi:glucosamine--fructose-6-phosphate aminotransferase (isomerizing)
LPEKVPYLGMGSSFFAAQVLRYLGVKIFPELAGEYYHYIRKINQFENGVLISQSGRTTDVLNCADCFKGYLAIVNDADSPLANQPNVKRVISIFAGDERHSSTKTFINTLIVLYLGHGFDVKNALDTLERRFSELEILGGAIGSKLARNIRKRKVRCINIVGNGPNVGTAYQAALMLSESTKFPFVGMSLTQYEHGYKETADNSVVIVINPLKSILYNRTQTLIEVMKDAGAKVFEISETELEEAYSPFTCILPFFFMAKYLSVMLGVDEPFQVGKKFTERNDEV